MLNVFLNPVEAIEEAKKYGEFVITLAVLAISAVLIAAAPLIAAKMLLIWIMIGIFFGFIAGAFLGAFFLMVVLSILGAKKAGYFESLTAITYSFAPLSVALFAASILLLIPWIGLALAALAAVFGGIVMVSTHLRALIELTETDLLTAIVSAWIITAIGSVLGYITFAASMAASLMSSIAAGTA